MVGRLQSSSSESGDQFDNSISLSGDGNTLAVGAPNERSALDAWAMYVFRRNGGMWSQQAHIKSLNLSNDDDFGNAVSLGCSGGTLAMVSFINSSKPSAVYLYLFRPPTHLTDDAEYVRMVGN